MQIHQLRNATLLLQFGKVSLLVDPVLGEVGSLPAFKLAGGGRRANPLVPLPEGTDALLSEVTDILVTHAHHADHLDGPAAEWITERKLPVWASDLDAPFLESKRLDVRRVADRVAGAKAEVVAASHGRGVMGWMMGPVNGFYLEPEGEPSVYLTSDAVLTDALASTLQRLQPDIIVAPAGAANFGVGPDILFSVDELVQMAGLVEGELVFNHLEALDHCPTTRTELRARLEREGLSHRTHVPEDGESISFEAPAKSGGASAILPSIVRKPGLQKWLVNGIARLV